MLIEPEDSTWYLPDGRRMNTRFDGGPTSWKGYIVPASESESYREFALEFQDSQLAYDKDSTTRPKTPYFKWFQLAGIKPADLNPGQLPPTPDSPIRVQIAAQGLVLTPDATIAVVEPGVLWSISENMAAHPTPETAKDEAQNEIFYLRAVTPGMVDTLNVYAPSALFNIDPDQYAEIKKLLNVPGSLPANSPIRQQFQFAGITLAADADLAVILKDEAWTINCHGQREIYRIRNNFVGYDYTAVKADGSKTTAHLNSVLQVYTPSISPGWEDPEHALNAGQSDLNGQSAFQSPIFLNKTNGPPFPQLVISGRQGTMGLNYRSEPIPLRLNPGPDPRSSDLAFEYSSVVPRNDPDLNVQPAGFSMDVALEPDLKAGLPVAPSIRDEFSRKAGVSLPAAATVENVGSSGKEWKIVSNPAGGPVTTYLIKESDLNPKWSKRDPRLYVYTKIPGTDRLFPPPIVPLSADPKDGGVTGGDPFTPLMRAYANDNVQVRALVGAI